MIWFSFFGMSLVAIAFVVAPFFGKKGGFEALPDSTSSVLVDQLEEVQRDLDRGVISKSDSAAASLEIKRRMLALAKKPILTTMNSSGAEGRALMILAALFVPVFAFGYYSMTGAPNQPSLAFVDRQEERADERGIVELTQKLLDRLENDPEGGPTEGWMLLGQTYMRMGAFEGAIQAFETVSSRQDATSATLSMLAEALIQSEQGLVSPQASTAIDRALEMNSGNPAAIFYKAVALDQVGETTLAYDLLVSRLNEVDEFEPWMESFVVEANRLGVRLGRAQLSLADYAPMAPPGPSAADIEAAGDMTADDRNAFVRSMVERLATRLEDEPDDLDGWMRLANAYSVLGERENAVTAYEKAQILLRDAPKSDPRGVAVERALIDLKG